MSPLCFILMLLIFITIPTLIYTFFHIIKCPPNTFLPTSSQTNPRVDGDVAGDDEKPVVGRLELVTVIVAKLDNAREDCPVCLSTFVEGEELWQLNLCNHLFHGPCIHPWLHARSSCPVCRALVIFPKRSLVVPAVARDHDLWQGLPDSTGLV